MQRREFIVGLRAAITGSIRTDAQGTPRLPLAGYLDDGPVEGFIFRPVEFCKGLAAAAYSDGSDVAIEAHRGRLSDWDGELGPHDDATVVRSMIADVRGAAIPIGRGIEVFYARDVDDIDAAFTGLVEKRSEVLFVSPSSFFSSHRMEIVALAAQHRVPALYFERDFAEAGGLMSYGPNISEQYRLLGVYAGRILSGQKPGDLPVRRATRLEFVINLKTAKALGLTIPATLLATADEVIQ